MTVAMVSALAMILSGCGGDAEEASGAFLARTNVTSNTTSNITTAAPENSSESTFYDGEVANATVSSAPGMANETNMTESDSGNSTGSQMPNSTASTNATANATVGNESSAPTTNSSA